MLTLAFCVLATVQVQPCDPESHKFSAQLLKSPTEHIRLISSIRMVDGPASTDLASRVVSLPRHPADNLDLSRQIGRLVDASERPKYPYGSFPDAYALTLACVRPDPDPIEEHKAAWIERNVSGMADRRSILCDHSGPTPR